MTGEHFTARRTRHVMRGGMKGDGVPALRLVLLTGLVLAAITAALLLPPIPQDPVYHEFADRRTLLGIPGFMDVASNFLFLVAGALGIGYLLTHRDAPLVPGLYGAYLLFFAGVFFVGIGSAYYHLRPSNATLIWDRLPMTITFMSLFTIILAEFVSVRAARWLFLPLLVVGVASVGYWHFSEQLGRGDLRWYGLVQFLPMLLIPVILLSFPARFSHARLYWAFLGLYALAKLFEFYDRPVYRVFPGISGHSLKHLCAATGCLVFLYLLKKRHTLTHAGHR
jgi:hypothetical protein